MSRWRWTLALAVTVSVAGNVAYALLTATPAHAVGAAAAAAVAPTMLFLITHNLAAEGRGAAAGWRHRASFVGAWAITLAAFAASYVELHALMILLGRSPVSAVLTPLIVDVAIAVASLRVLAANQPVVPPSSQTRGPGRWQRLSDALVTRAEAALVVPQNVQLETVTEGSAEAGTEGSAEVDGGVHESVTEGSKAGSTKSVAGVREPVRGGVRGGSAKGSVKPAVDPELEPFMEAAQRLAEAGTVRGKTVADYARILRAVDAGWSATKIKNELGVSHPATAKVVAAASDAGRRALTVV